MGVRSVLGSTRPQRSSNRACVARGASMSPSTRIRFAVRRSARSSQRRRQRPLRGETKVVPVG